MVVKKLPDRESSKLQGSSLIHSTTKTFGSDVLGTKVPAVVDFYADWCGPCRMVAPIIQELAQEFEGKVRFVKVNVDDNPELADQYGVSGIPTVIFFRDGKETYRLSGAGRKDYYRQQINHVLLT